VTCRADLHVHSQCSANPTNPWIRRLGGRECYTAPEDVYAAARARGMDFVTITDHNTLDGSYAIAHLPGTFLSTEFDAWFPENGCRVHVVALGIDDATFAAALQARESIYDLVACLREAGVVHFLAHPLFDMTGKLDEDVVEKLLLLFNVLEGRNGARVVRCNGLLRDIAAGLTPDSIAAMAERQGIEPYSEAPWRKALTGGSDDHSGLFVAGVHTEAECDGTVESFLGAVGAGRGVPVGEEGDARILANSIYASAFWRFREMLRLDEEQPRKRALKLVRKGFGKIGRDVPVLDKAKRGVRNIVPGLYLDGDGRGPAWEELLDREIGTLVADQDGFYAVGSRELNRRLFEVSQRLADDVVSLHLQALLDPGTELGLKRRLQKHYAVGMVHFLQLPHFISWSIQSRDRASQERLRRHFLGGEPPLPKVAVFTDSWGEADGVALGVRHLAETARARGVELEVITSTPAPTGRADGAVNFQALAARPPAAAPGHVLAAPPIVDVIDYLEENDFTAIHASTAGAMGLLAMLAAKLLHLPIAATFQAGLPGHAERLHPGSSQPRLTRRYVMWFYGTMDEVFVPSRSAARDLVARGLDPRRVTVLPRRIGAELIEPGQDEGGAGRGASALHAVLTGDGRHREPGRAGRAQALEIAGPPHAHGEAILDRLGAPAPPPGRRHPGALRRAMRRRPAGGGRRQAGRHEPGATRD
jgi:hypothetical protein